MKRTMRRGEMLVAAAAAAVLVPLAAGCSQKKATAKGPRGYIVLEVEPPQARVFVNEVLQGSAEGLAGKRLALVPGSYRVKLTAPGYFPEYREVTVGKEVVTLEVVLRKVPPPLLEPAQPPAGEGKDFE